MDKGKHMHVLFYYRCSGLVGTYTVIYMLSYKLCGAVNDWNHWLVFWPVITASITPSPALMTGSTGHIERLPVLAQSRSGRNRSSPVLVPPQSWGATCSGNCPTGALGRFRDSSPDMVFLPTEHSG
jgi:hypothetical protein